MSEAKLKVLEKARSTVKGSMTRIVNFLNENEIIDQFDLELRKDKLEEFFKQFNNVQDEIEILEDAAGIQNKEVERDTERSSFETKYYKCCQIIRQRLSTINKNHVINNSAIRTIPEIQNESKKSILPKIEIKQFDGNPLQWRSFKNTFKSLVHDSTTISSMHKFQILKNSLSGEIASILDSLDGSEEQYGIAWDLLAKRCDQPRVIVNAHIHAIFELASITKESPLKLRTLRENAEKHVNALKSLKEQCDPYNALLIYIIVQKLDKITRRAWERSLEEDAKPTFDELTKFIMKYERGEEIEIAAINAKSIPGNSKVNTSRSQALVGTQKRAECFMCNEEHNIFNCKKFLNYNPRERSDIAKSKKLCLNCLRDNHVTNKCYSSGCKKCSKKHNTLLHFNKISDKSLDFAEKTVDEASKEQTNIEKINNSYIQEKTKQTYTIIDNSEVLLGTARIKILDKNNKEHDCRVLLDSCSQTNFITERLANQLSLNKIKINLPFAGLAEMKTRAGYKVKTCIKSYVNNYEKLVEFVALPRIIGLLPSQFIEKRTLDIPKNIKLSDVEFNKPAEIEALIGATLYYELLGNGQIKVPNNRNVTIQKTLLGWIIAGQVNMQCDKRVNCLISTELDDQLKKFWEIEEITCKKHLSCEEKECERLYNETTRRDENGKYVVSLPFNNQKKKLGESYNAALRRYLNLERKLNENLKLKHEYNNCLKEYLDLNHMINITNNDNIKDGYYIPHHAVIKRDNITTKVRVVFDASAKTTSNISLNDTLLTGPTVQAELIEIILRFRCHNIVIAADLQKMYRQVKVNEHDAKFQKILWRSNDDESIQTFQLTTVTQGTASAPYLATRTLVQLAQDEQNNYPDAAEIIKHDFYVDDLLTGAKDIKSAIYLKNNIINILKSGGYTLHKWASNAIELVNEESKLAAETVNLDNCTRKLLGIHWNAKNDNFCYLVKEADAQKRISKRMILSQIAQLFDPLGLLGPIIVYSKIILQKLWSLKLAWDESVPQELFSLWNNFRNDLKLVKNFNIQRKIILPDAVDIQLHGFADASQDAYGACVYLRVVDNKQDCIVNLICAKSRVAPIKTMKVPRLELCAAVLLAKLMKYVQELLKLHYNKILFWSDSTIVLHQINTSPHLLKTFVANRVAIIQTISNHINWKHISTDENPADALSRGQMPKEFLQNKLWLFGPHWLNHNENEWNILKLSKVDDIPDKKIISLVCTEITDEILNRFSSISKLNRFLALCLRIFRRSERIRKLKDITLKEIEVSHIKIIKIIQSLHFAEEIKQLKEKTMLNKKSKLLCLSPFLDSEGIIRVGGRLKNASLNYNKKYPILLPKHNHITNLIIKEVHENRWHSGVFSTLNTVRVKYWPIDGKTTTRNIIKKCVRCCRHQPTLTQYRMADLPTDRVNKSRPFQVVGIDYCGPFFIKQKKFRNTQKEKAYVAVFVCFATKAVHLELVTDLTTESCLEAIKRFIGRRGTPNHIYSDNATNFVGAKNEIIKTKAFLLSNEYNEKISNSLQKENIQWHFSPPRSPHFGVLWEAVVKSFKNHLLKTVGQALFTYEQFNTCIIQIEAILNSRPLTPLSNDPNDLNALTPFHFLIGEYSTCMSEFNFINTPINRLSAGQHIQKVKQDFWQRWHREYLNELRTRSKRHMGDGSQIKTGTLVTIKDENLHPMQWKLGRIVAVHPGADNITRVATIKTADGEYKRSINKLAPLPVEA